MAPDDSERLGRADVEGCRRWVRTIGRLAVRAALRGKLFTPSVIVGVAAPESMAPLFEVDSIAAAGQTRSAPKTVSWS